MMNKPIKKRSFIIEDDSLDSPFYAGDIEGVLQHIRASLEEAKDGDDFYFDITRHDMSQDEIDALPEV